MVWKREWISVCKRSRSDINEDYYYLNGDIYTDLDEPLRLARRHIQRINKPMRIWKKDSDLLLSTYRTSNAWGEALTEKMSIDEIWPIFETYARML